MVGSYLVPYTICSSSSLLLRPLLACYQHPSLHRSIHTGREKHGETVIENERAASTAEEFLKIAEEKAEHVTSETSDKESDSCMVNATTGDTGGDIDVDKERLQPVVEEGSYKKTPSE